MIRENVVKFPRGSVEAITVFLLLNNSAIRSAPSNFTRPATAGFSLLRPMTSERLHAYLLRVGGGSPSFRLCLLLMVWSSSLATTVPESAIGHLLKDAQFIGWIMFWLAGAGVVETIINDYLPGRYRWDFALRWRHLALMSCCGYFLVLIFLVTQSKISNLVMPYFVIVAFFLAWNAFMDVWKRFGPGKE